METRGRIFPPAATQLGGTIRSRFTYCPAFILPVIKLVLSERLHSVPASRLRVARFTQRVLLGGRLIAGYQPRLLVVAPVTSFLLFRRLGQL